MGVTEAYKVFGRMKDQTVISDWLNTPNVGTHNRRKTDALYAWVGDILLTASKWEFKFPFETIVV